MSKQQELEMRISQEFRPHFLKVGNESHLHGARDGESHFKVVLVSERFEGMRPVKRHQLVYQLLADDLQGSVHALALHTYTPEEWDKQGHMIPRSTKCSGGDS